MPSNGRKKLIGFSNMRNERLSRKPLKIFLSAILSLLCLVSHAQNKFPDFIKLDTLLKKAVLPNGLTYYIRPNQTPANRVELRLLVKTGSVDEDDDQRGIAHFLEHMAFNGTKNFKKNELINYLQDIGMSFGNDLNAFTFFGHTSYELSVPTNKPENLDKAFRVLSDWAQNITFLDDDIDAEREIILEEMRLTKGVVGRIQNKVVPLAYKGSRYADRAVIGTEASIKKIKSADLKKFYKDWYRPDLMALVVVGDVSDIDVAHLIEKYFSSLTSPLNPRKRITDSIPKYEQNFAKIYTDSELSEYTINILYSLWPSRFPDKKEDLKTSLIQSVIIDLLNYRFYEYTMKGVGFSNASMVHDYGDIPNYSRMSGRLVIPTDEMIIPALETYTEEIARVKKFGFKENEWNRVKNIMSAINVKAFNERNKIESKILISRISDDILSNKQTASFDWLHDATAENLAAVTLKDINKEAADMLPESLKYFVYLAGPDSKKLPTETDLLDVLSAKRKRVKDVAKEKNTPVQKLLKTEPVAGSIISEEEDKVLGVKKWRLSNGATVLIKKTDFKDDEILFGASRLGGTSNFDAKNRYNYEYGLKVIDLMGYGNYTPLDLEKMLSGKLAMVTPFWDDALEGYMGYSSKTDLETLLQLTYLKATAPNVNIITFISSVNRSKLESANAVTNPESVFFEEFLNKLYDNNIRKPITISRPQYFEKLDLLSIMNMYRERLSNVSGMEFVFVGNIDEEALKPLVAKYIAGIPSSKNNNTVGSNWLKPVKGIHTISINKGKDDKSLIVSMYTDSLAYNEELKLNMEAVSEILNIRIQENLREKMQGTYSAEVSFNFARYPYPNYSFIISIPTGSEKIEGLINALNEDIINLKNNGPSLADVNNLKEKWIEENKAGLKMNERWISYLLMTRLNGESFNFFANRAEYIRQLTPASIQKAANIIFSSGNNFTAILRPEK